MLKTKCPLCDSTGNYKVLYKSNFKKDDLCPDVFSARRVPDSVHYQIVRCNNDGLVRSTPVYEQNNLEFLYKRSKFTYAEQISNLTISYLKALDKVLPSLSRESKILEIGCGNGFILSALLEQGYKNVYGVEPSLDAIQKADSRVKAHIAADTLKEEMFKKESFDFIYFFQTFDHVYDPLGFLNICHGLLSPGGFILAFNHNVESFSAKLLKEKSPIIDIEHTYLYSKNTIGKIFAKADFVPLKIFSPTSVISLRYLVWLLPIPKVVKLKILNQKNTFLDVILRLNLWIKLGNLCIIAKKEPKDT